MATRGVSVELYDAIRDAEKRQKAVRQHQSDMLVDMALEWAYLRGLLRRVVIVAANARGSWGVSDADIALLKEAASAAGLDPMTGGQL